MLALAPVAAAALLATLRHRDWRLCMDMAATGLADVINRREIALTLPVIALPFALFGGLYYRHSGRSVLWLWGLAVGILLLPLAFDDFHHCDRKGSTATLWLLIAAVPGLGLWLAALALRAPEPRPR